MNGKDIKKVIVSSVVPDSIFNLKVLSKTYFNCLPLIVGSENSSNSQRLVEVAQKAGCQKSFLISDVNYINWKEIDQVDNIGLSSGASAPEILIEDIRNKFSELYNTKEIQNYSLFSWKCRFLRK